jgi:hypothetical protein
MPLLAQTELTRFSEMDQRRYLLPSFINHSTQQEYRKGLDLAMNALNDPDLGVRLAASITSGHLGDASAIPALQATLAVL